MKSSKIIIKSCPHSQFLRTEGVSKAIEFEDTYMFDGRKPGHYNGVLWTKSESVTSSWSIYAYHTKNGSIVVDIRLDSKFDETLWK